MGQAVSCKASQGDHPHRRRLARHRLRGGTSLRPAERTRTRGTPTTIWRGNRPVTAVCCPDADEFICVTSPPVSVKTSCHYAHSTATELRHHPAFSPCRRRRLSAPTGHWQRACSRPENPLTDRVALTRQHAKGRVHSQRASGRGLRKKTNDFPPTR